jgi:hypothetical protein
MKADPYALSERAIERLRDKHGTTKHPDAEIIGMTDEMLRSIDDIEHFVLTGFPNDQSALTGFEFAQMLARRMCIKLVCIDTSENSEKVGSAIQNVIHSAGTMLDVLHKHISPLVDKDEFDWGLHHTARDDR